jgi:thymidylate synthase (FAD)
MKVSLKAITPEVEKTIVEIARVSSSRTDKGSQPEGLLNYLIRNKHWSPFEHGFITMEIECSKAIGIQLIRHRSFTFQEFSQRYQNVSKLGEEMFEPVEIRRQATDNRQSSEEVFDPEIHVATLLNPTGMPSKPTTKEEIFVPSSMLIEDYLKSAESLYKDLLRAGVAREQARLVLPLATKTRIFMSGSVRSWIHFLDLRDDSHAQKEAQQIARGIKEILVKELPVISKALDWPTDYPEYKYN